MKRDDAVPFPRAEPVVRLLRAAERSTQSLRPAFPGESGQNKTLLQLSCLNAQLQKRSEGPQPFSTVSLSGVHVVDATGVSHKLSLFCFCAFRSFLRHVRAPKALRRWLPRLIERHVRRKSLHAVGNEFPSRYNLPKTCRRYRRCRRIISLPRDGGSAAFRPVTN